MPPVIQYWFKGALPVRGGGLNACQDGLGHLFREEVPQFKWAICLIVGGSKCLPGWFGALTIEKNYQVQIGPFEPLFF